MNQFKVGTRIKVIHDGFGEQFQPSEDNLIGWTGTVTKVYRDGDLCIDLDPEQSPEEDLTGLYFGPSEVEVVE